MLLHPYQTLVREIATPTIPAFATACLQIIKPASPDQQSSTPLAAVETICDAFSTLIPLYPTTIRPSSSHIKTAVKSYLAPTESDGRCIPASLQKAARRLVVSLHHVAAKSGGSDEWAKLLRTLLSDTHATADQVLRAVDESWEATDGNARPAIDFDGEPRGGGSAPEELPPWSGLNAGVDRLVGLIHYLAECLRYPTKTAITLPLSALMDVVSRLCLIARLSPKTQTWDQAVETNAAIGRDERDELWSLVPEIHIASFELVRTLFQRLDQDMLPLVPEVLDHLVRVFKSGMDISVVRMTGYATLEDIMSLAGPTMSKTAVDMLDPLVRACCRDLQQDAGQLKQGDKNQKSTPDSKKNGAAANADLFLQSPATNMEEIITLDPDHVAAASALLSMIFTHLPQQNLKPGLRGLVEKTAILTSNRNAMLASVLNPYKDRSGRMHRSLLPHFAQQFPQDQGLEILRTNLRTDTVQNGDDGSADELEDDGDDDEDMEDAADGGEDTAKETAQDLWRPGTLPAAPLMEVDQPVKQNPFNPNATEKPATQGAFGDIRAEADSPPKRKYEGSNAVPAKRQEVEKAEIAQVPLALDNVNDDDDDSDESVHLNMELDDIEEDEDED